MPHQRKLDEKFMRLAISKAREGIGHGQSPFGACLVRKGRVVVCEHNIVWETMDVTAHAEIHVLRSACKKLKTIDLSGSTMYATCEPCPMCYSACHWARISRIVYGAHESDAQKYGFNELRIPDLKMRKYERLPVKIVPGFLHSECLELFELWAKRKTKRPY